MPRASGWPGEAGVRHPGVDPYLTAGQTVGARLVAGTGRWASVVRVAPTQALGWLCLPSLPRQAPGYVLTRTCGRRFSAVRLRKRRRRLACGRRWGDNGAYVAPKYSVQVETYELSTMVLQWYSHPGISSVPLSFRGLSSVAGSLKRVGWCEESTVWSPGWQIPLRRPVAHKLLYGNDLHPIASDDISPRGPETGLCQGQSIQRHGQWRCADRRYH